MSWSTLKYKISRNIAPIGEVASKHRRSLIFTSASMLLLNPAIEITIGKASIAGLGIEISPTQNIPLALGLFCLLVYFFIAFWVSVLIEGGTDINRARANALDDYDPTHKISDPNAHSMEDVIREESNYNVYKWNFRRIVWEVFFPSAIALIAIVRFLYWQIVAVL